MWQILVKLQFLLILFEFLLREGSFWNTLNVCNTQWRIDLIVSQQHSLFPKNTSKVHLFIISDSFKRILTWPSKEFAFRRKQCKNSIKRKICQRLSLSYPILCFYLVLTIPVRLQRHLYSTVRAKERGSFGGD